MVAMPGTVFEMMGNPEEMARMRYAQVVMPLVVFAGMGIWGCSRTDSQGTSEGGAPAAQEAKGPGALAAAPDGPEAAVREFLEAVRTGDDKKTEAMFTRLAREKIKEMEDIQVAPPGSDTASFEVGTAEYLAEDGARVKSKWTDLDREGKPRTDEITWMLRKESEGWRIAGMAATVFEGEDPLLLDFENPKETLRKLELLREEIRQRTEAQAAQAAPKPAAGPGGPVVEAGRGAQAAQATQGTERPESVRR